ncbi:choice-of-anchor P family protein [Actinokineospora iranica]|uniref:LPXTG-motif cell wall anchor domain-containing protein n=1 Tax=Actinokineospora iranica TaxID=1271860 RepID=A0A1G6WL70_9PSEU|nr:choice-of-anchor P family protein [Actinokineospora iranica]SDD65967.1 hypothetical protein SAMN05216174_11539 [Actinokineospora iranica]
MRRTRMLALAGGLAGTASLAAVLTAPLAVAEGTLTGSAFAVSVDAALLKDLVSVDVDPLPKATYPAGQEKSVVKIDAEKSLGLAGHAKLLNAASEAKGGVLKSESSIADVNILDLIKAKLITADCVSDGKTTTGKSSLAEVEVAGVKIDAAVTAEIKVSDLVTVLVNEQIVEGNKLTVNALHVKVGGAVKNVAQADVILSQATCTGPGAVVTPPEDGEKPPVSSTNPGTPGESTAPSKPGDNGGNEPSPSAPASSWPATSASVSTTPAAAAGVSPAGNSGDLAETGVSAIVPLSIGGIVLLAGGGAAVWMTRRKRAATAGAGE